MTEIFSASKTNYGLDELPLVICEVSLRDGLQNETKCLSVEQKLDLIRQMENAGIRQIEIGSFVHPKAVPQMANSDELASELHKKKVEQLQHATSEPFHPQARYLGLILNKKGLERALKAGVDGVCIVGVVSDSLSAKNNNSTAEASFKTAVELLKQAKSEGLFTRVDIATAWNCPYEGEITLDQVEHFADQIWEHGPDELAFCDSIGHANPIRVTELFRHFGQRYGFKKLAAHFHDTKGLGLANATAALLSGVRRFDASLGGLGGCPFAPGARGNLATEDLIHLLNESGFKSEISLKELKKIVASLSNSLSKPGLGGQTLALKDFQTGARP